jgi:predicted TIM-barrel fold metal-dependent hydrolase
MRRREFLIGAGAGAAMLHGAIDTQSTRAEDASPIAAIDTHIHFFRPAPADTPAAAGSAQKSPPLLPAEWQQVANRCDVTQAVVIESSPDVEDNQRLLDLTRQHPWIVGVVGRLPIGEPGCAALIDRFASHRRFRGIRLGSDPLLAGLENAEFLRDLERLAEKGLVVDVIGPTRIAAGERLAARLPRMRVLLEHMAGAMIDGEKPDPRWLDGIASAARHDNVFLKVSHVIQSAARDAEAPDMSRYAPWLAAVWDAFGDRRVMFGTDWPVSLRHASYVRIHDLVRQFVAGRGANASRRFFTENARDAYGLPDSA